MYVCMEKSLCNERDLITNSDYMNTLLMFYFIITFIRKISIIGKHTKKITCGAWSAENLLALGSDDKTISISNVDGDTLRQTQLRAEPLDIEFSEMKGDERSSVGENTVCWY